MMDRRRALMMQAKEEKPKDISAFADTSTPTVSVEENIFTVNYTSGGRGVYRTLPFTSPLSLNTGDIFTIKFLDGMYSIKAKGTGLGEKVVSNSELSWTLTGEHTLSAMNFATTGSSATARVTRCQVLINDEIVIGNAFS